MYAIKIVQPTDQSQEGERLSLHLEQLARHDFLHHGMQSVPSRFCLGDNFVDGGAVGKSDACACCIDHQLSRDVSGKGIFIVEQ